MLRFRALGRPIVDGPEGAIGGAAAQRKPLALLSLLAVAGSRGMSRDKILGYLWPETPQDRATHRLTQVLYSLRHQLHTDDLFLGSADLRLNPDRISTDLTDFHQALAEHCPDRAVGVYSGPFLEGFFVTGGAEFEHWVDGERADLDGRYRAALEMLAEQAMASADHVAAAHWCGRLAQANPLNAQVAIRYMEALAQTGDRAGALKFARSHQSRLREELDAGPDSAVTAAAERLRDQAADEPSVAVLPFVNMSLDRDNDYFSDGITEELTNALAHVVGLRVASRTSAFTFKGKDLDVGEIGVRLAVKSVVEGSVRKVGSRVRITAQLVDTASGYHLWSETYDRDLADVFALQEEISQAIVRVFSVSVHRPQNIPVVRTPTAVVEAYTLYLRGRHFALKRTIESLQTAIDYFEQAIELDQDYALAYAGIGECYTLRGFEEFGDLPPREAMPRARAALERALILDAHVAEGYACRGMLAFLFEYDWSRAERSFQQAIELKPGYALAHAWYSLFLSAMGRQDEALTRMNHAEQLDPMSVPIQTVVGHCHYLARRFDDALQRHLATLEIDPRNMRLHAWIARIHAATGGFEHGLRTLEAAMRHVGRPPILLAQLGRFLAALGRHQEAHEVIEELEVLGGRQYVSRLAAVYVHRALGNQNELFEGLEEAFEQRSGSLPFIGVDCGWDPVRREPRFKAMLQKMRLTSRTPTDGDPSIPALAAHQQN
jgi:TolB-like protein/Tfp pilus assembly protein PilF